MVYLIFGVAMVALIGGAHIAIKESERIALRFDISPFVIGATLIALGTSLPEMAASWQASYRGSSDLAVSNVMGSVIFNITLVLGLVFLFATKKIAPDRDLFAKDSAWALFPPLMFILLILDGTITRFEGVIFALMVVAYLLFLARDEKELVSAVDESIKKAPFNWLVSLPLLIAGFVLIVAGAHFTIESAATIAAMLGVSEWVIGLLLVAFGTSLPELVVSLMAALKGNGDMSIGNIIGSNVANFTVVLGGAAVVSPLAINLEANLYDITAAMVATVMLVFITANKLYGRSAGLVLLSVTALVVYNAVI
jgi:cation:H+ antiporter